MLWSKVLLVRGEDTGAVEQITASYRRGYWCCGAKYCWIEERIPLLWTKYCWLQERIPVLWSKVLLVSGGDTGAVEKSTASYRREYRCCGVKYCWLLETGEDTSSVEQSAAVYKRE